MDRSTRRSTPLEINGWNIIPMEVWFRSCSWPKMGDLQVPAVNLPGCTYPKKSNESSAIFSLYLTGVFAYWSVADSCPCASWTKLFKRQVFRLFAFRASHRCVVFPIVIWHVLYDLTLDVAYNFGNWHGLDTQFKFHKNLGIRKLDVGRSTLHI